MATSAILRDMLRAHYGEPYAMFHEVSDATGHRGTGWCDTIAVSLWPSYGLEIIGHEIKVSKQDWKRERAKPEKNDKFFARCDRFYVVATHGVVDLAEVPENWGFMETAMVKGVSKLVTVKTAPKNENVLPIERSFFASLARAAGKISHQRLSDATEKIRTDYYKRLEEAVKAEVERRRDTASRDVGIIEKIRERCKELGCSFPGDHQIVDAVAMVLASGATGYGGLIGAYTQSRSAFEYLEKILPKLGLELPQDERTLLNAKVKR